MRTLLVLLSVLVATSLALADSPAPSTQPATAPTSQPRVFRCVLDGNPRMLVIDFRNGVMAAFDTQKCELVKVWRGDVEFTGTVYDTKHGPQPRSRGEEIDLKTLLDPLNGPTTTKRVWQSYSLQNESVSLWFDQPDHGWRGIYTLKPDRDRIIVDYGEIVRFAQ
jgi:cytochrome c